MEPAGPIDRGIPFWKETPNWPLLLDVEVHLGNIFLIQAHCENCQTRVTLQSTATGWVCLANRSLIDHDQTPEERIFSDFLRWKPEVLVLYDLFLKSRATSHVGGYDTDRGPIMARIAAGDFFLYTGVDSNDISDSFRVSGAAAAAAELRREMEERERERQRKVEVEPEKTTFFAYLKRRFKLLVGLKSR
jgi:hypothetical protein